MEIAIRIAVGAPPHQVARVIVRKAIFVTAVGVLLGLGMSLFTTRLLEGLLFGITPRDPLALASGVLVLTTASVLASAIPALRAARIDPAITFRS
jgi:ABC-type antimicrobial peptide transport system permease subunit